MGMINVTLNVMTKHFTTLTFMITKVCSFDPISAFIINYSLLEIIIH